jgi:hypothetical protein
MTKMTKSDQVLVSLFFLDVILDDGTSSAERIAHI